MLSERHASHGIEAMYSSSKGGCIGDEARAVAGDQARLASRVAGEYILRSLRMLGELADGELLTSLVSMAIVQANVAYLDQVAAAENEFASVERVPPNEVRRPVSVLAISASLGLPYETTRRHVAKLIASGTCVRVKGGVIVPAKALVGEKHETMLRTNLANLRRLVRDLKRLGVVLD